MRNNRNAALNGGRGSGQTAKRITELYEEKIADLKANFDYVLEGKDLEIKQLKETDEYIIKTLENKVTKLQEDLRKKRISIKNKKAEIKELERKLEVTEKDLADYQFNYPSIKELSKENAELKQQIEKLKTELDNARESANRQEQWEIYSVLNDLYNDNFEITKGVSN